MKIKDDEATTRARSAMALAARWGTDAEERRARVDWLLSQASNAERYAEELRAKARSLAEQAS